MGQRAEIYLELVDATVEKRTAGSTTLAVNLDCEPRRCRRISIPKKYVEEHADGTVYVAKWILNDRQRELKLNGVNENILTRPGGYRY